MIIQKSEMDCYGGAFLTCGRCGKEFFRSIITPCLIVCPGCGGDENTKEIRREWDDRKKAEAHIRDGHV